MIAVVCARLSSRRLPGKLMYHLMGKPLLWWSVKQCVESGLFTDTVVALADEPGHEVLAAVAENAGAKWIVGNPKNVADRFWEAMKYVNADYAARVNADCPFPMLRAFEAINEMRDSDTAYALAGDIPIQLGMAEVVSQFAAAWAAGFVEGKLRTVGGQFPFTESWTINLLRGEGAGMFKQQAIAPKRTPPFELATGMRLCIDTPADYRFFQSLMAQAPFNTSPAFLKPYHADRRDLFLKTMDWVAEYTENGGWPDGVYDNRTAELMSWQQAIWERLANGDSISPVPRSIAETVRSYCESRAGAGREPSGGTD